MPLLEYDITVVGMQNVDKAFRSIEQKVAQVNSRTSRPFGAIEGGRGASAARVTINAAQIERARAREEAAKKRSDERASKASIREHEKAEREKTRVTEREARNRAKEEERWSANTRRLKEQHYRAEARTATAAARETERSALRARAEWTRSTSGTMAATGRGVAAVGRSGMMMAGIAGGALFANATHSYLQTSAEATSLAAQMAAPGESAESIRARRAGLLANAKGIQGFTTLAALQAQRAFGGKAGDYEMGGKLLPGLSKVSLATGVDLTDVAEVAANAYMKLAPTMKGKELEDTTMSMVRTFAGQGNVGSVEIKDLAHYAGRITSAAGLYQGTREQNMTGLGAMAQMAIGAGSAASAEEATTAVARFSNDIITKNKDLKKLGITAFDKKGKLRAPEELLVDIMKKTKGDERLLAPIFGEMSAKAVRGVSSIYTGAEENKKGTGEAAVRAEFAKFQKSAISASDLDARANAVLQDESLKIAENFKQLNDTVGSRLAPVLTQMVGKLADAGPTIGKFADVLAKVVEFLVKNPFTGVGAAVTLSITKEIASAKITEAIRGAILGGGPSVAGTSGTVAAGTAGRVTGAGVRAGVGAEVGAGIGAGIGAGGVLTLAATGVGAYLVTTAALEATDNTGDTDKRISAARNRFTNEVNRVNADHSLSPADKINAIESAATEANKNIGLAIENRSFSSALGSGGEREAKAARGDIQKELAAAEAQFQSARALQEATESLRELTANGVMSLSRGSGEWPDGGT